MSWSDTKLSAIEAMPDPRKRGLAFEGLIVELFSASHFEVRKNPGTARPRQTDLVATRAQDVYLIECKWRSSRADVADVDSLRSRMRRTHGAVGVLISMPGFSGTAISEVSDHREQPILLVSGEELRRIAGAADQLIRLLWQKLQALRIDGVALVDEPRSKPTKRKRSLPGTRSRFRMNGDLLTTPLVSGGGFDSIVFSHEIADIDWVFTSDTGVTVDLVVPTLSELDIVAIIEKLADLGWATADARWSIQQSRTNWHGLGAESFVSELPHWRRRSRSPEAHGSEEFCYVDLCAGGYYTLSATIINSARRETRDVDLSFELQGIPLDVSPLLQLCRSLGIHDDAYFRPRDRKSRELLRLPSWMSVPITPVGFMETVGDVFDHDAVFVTGIVIENPFRSDRWRQSNERELVDRGIEASDLIICHLNDYHTLDGGDYVYRLTKVESTRTTRVRVFRPGARWDRT
jgi:hypothetical protein